MWFYPAWGFGVWLVATVAIRISGHHILDSGQPIVTTLAFLMTIPLVAAVTVPVYDWRRTSLADRPTAAILLCLPGMLLDVVVLLLLGWVLPNMDGQETVFGAWLLWAYALVLATGLVRYTRMWKV